MLKKTTGFLLRRRRMLIAPSIERVLTGVGVKLTSAALQSAPIETEAGTVWHAGKNLADTNTATAAGFVGSNLPAGVELTLSAYIASAVGGNVRVRLQYSLGGTQYITGSYVGTGQWSVASGLIPAGATNVQAYIQRQSSTQSFSAEQIQVEIGSERTAFEPYKFRDEITPAPDQVLLVPGGNSVWTDGNDMTIIYKRYGWQED